MSKTAEVITSFIEGLKTELKSDKAKNFLRDKGIADVDYVLSAADEDLFEQLLTSVVEYLNQEASGAEKDYATAFVAAQAISRLTAALTGHTHRVQREAASVEQVAELSGN